jgi:hypothetical protein
MEMKKGKKRFNFAKVLSLTFEFVLKFPLYVILPALALLAIYSIQIYLNHTMAVLKYISIAEMAAKGIQFSFNDRLIQNLVFYSITFIYILIDFIIISGYVRMVKKWMEQKIEPAWNDFFAWKISLFGQYLVANLIYLFFGLIGLLFLIVPGFIIFTVFYFAIYEIIDRQEGISRAFSRSTELVKGVKIQIFGLILFYILSRLPLWFVYGRHSRTVNITFMLGFTLIGTLFIFLIYQLMTVYLYFDLSTQQDAIDNQLQINNIEVDSIVD